MSSSSFVCLPCQLRLGAFGRRRILTGSTTQLKRHFSAPSSGVNGTHDNGDDKKSTVFRKTTMLSKRNGDPGAPGSSEFFLSQGTRIFMKSEKLNIGVLGRPAEAIVLKNVGNVRRPLPATVEIAEAHGEAIDALEALADESKPATKEEAETNIDELRLPDGDVISERKFQELGAVLMNGFTIAQLQGYLEKYKRKTPQSIVPGYIQEQHPWVPVTPGMAEEGDVEPLLRGYIDKAMPRKQRLVVRLMRKCWHVSIQELMDGPGHLDVQVARDVEFGLLMLGTQGWLQTVSRHFSRPGDHVELFPSTMTMRIIASRPVAETMLAEIYLHLGRIKHKTFARDGITAQLVDNTGLREVGQITNTRVKIHKSSGKVDVRWITMEAHNPDLEDLGDTVFRLLLSAYGTKRLATTHMHICQQPQLEGRLVKQFVTRDKLAWNTRSMSWHRWIGSATRKPKHQIAPAIRPGMLPWDMESPVRDNPVTEPQEWPSKPTTITTAVFGHVLHSSGADSGLRSTTKTQPSAHLERIISPILPPLFGMPFELSASGGTQPTVLLRFLPNPADPRAASAPALELTLDASGAETVQPVTLAAITSTQHTDVLFPSEQTDVRITQTRTFSLPGSAFPSLPGLQPLLDFISRSHLRLDEGNLATPAALPQLGLPKQLFTPSGTAPAGNVDYLFAGLELRRCVVSSYHGWRLLFTSVEAGKGGGRRTEMSLTDGPADLPLGTTRMRHGQGGSFPDAEDVGNTEDTVGRTRQVVTSPLRFLDAVMKLVQGQEMKWIGEKE